MEMIYYNFYIGLSQQMHYYTSKAAPKLELLLQIPVNLDIYHWRETIRIAKSTSSQC